MNIYTNNIVNCTSYHSQQEEMNSTGNNNNNSNKNNSSSSGTKTRTVATAESKVLLVAVSLPRAKPPKTPEQPFYSLSPNT